MGISFGKKKSAPTSRVTEQDKAILQLKQMRDKLKQYRNKIETKLVNEREIAKELVKSGKLDKAKLLLKKKRFYENNIAKTDQSLDNLDQMITNLEYTQIEHKVVECLKVGNESLKNLHEMLTIDQIEDIMDDTKEAIEHQRQIDELLGNQLNEESLDEINQELEEIIASSMPEVPTHEINQKVKEKVKEKETSRARVPVMAD
ncbi:charged multivesicular body 6 [Brachionus plicatilis]|uniref:Charged multivesicular body 6 n=1 Tax=Brachionus plicatilis TaxID=10195 RepID=A0A3M7T7M2_BRAPC|nr:charged multivesicular body 6 [Brachionus plicatilis]